MELTEKQAYWKSHLEAAESFDGSLVDYARAHEKAEILRHWQLKLKADGAIILQTKLPLASNLYWRHLPSRLTGHSGVTIRRDGLAVVLGNRYHRRILLMNSR